MRIEHLTVLYDAECGFCSRCRAWLEKQSSWVELELLAKDSFEVSRRFPGLECPHDELVVIDDAGGVYRGPNAFILCLYALEDYREWALRLSSPALRSTARLAFELVSSNRHRINDWLKLRSDADIARKLQLASPFQSPRCTPGG